MQQQESERNIVLWCLLGAAAVLAVVWAFSIVFEIALVKSLAVVIVLLFLAAVAALLLGVF